MADNMEIEETEQLRGQDKSSPSLLQRVTDSPSWKFAMKIKDFALALWMGADIGLDVISCHGYYTKWKVSFCIKQTNFCQIVF